MVVVKILAGITFTLAAVCVILFVYCIIQRIRHKSDEKTDIEKKVKLIFTFMLIFAILTISLIFLSGYIPWLN